ncbi:MAG: amino acid carrier protein [Selenomonas sp.]|jgi:AGCS family alanine or glycine:cation symporter|nr:amino acid carrier protein [Selenomonas sp.]
MEQLFAELNHIFSFVIPLSDFFWEFPTNISWYKSIPVLGNFSLAVICLFGAGLFFTCRTGAIQITHFASGVRLLAQRKSHEAGISALSAFLLSSAMRVGPGNILGVTGAISVGGPGALFWMWVSATVGMATAYGEAVLAQIFKERKDEEFVGGLPFYGRKLLQDRKGGWYLAFSHVHHLCDVLHSGPGLQCRFFDCPDGQSHAGNDIANLPAVQAIVISILMIAMTAWIAFGGIRMVTRVTNGMVPVMAILYLLTVLLLTLTNLDQLPYFFSAVFGGAFSPDAIFGGLFGTVLVQGVKRGLMSNEAGQGTITMAAACADNQHPCEQGLVQSIGVFLDTWVICSCTGFVVIMAHPWAGADGTAWMALDKLPKFLASARQLTPAASLETIVALLICFCFCLFAFTCLVGMISFSEIAANRISRKASVINTVRLTGVFIAAFGICCSLAGIDLGNLWSISDLGNILIVFTNVPLLMIGSKYILRATRHFKAADGSPFTSTVIGWKSGALWWDSNENLPKENCSPDGQPVTE